MVKPMSKFETLDEIVNSGNGYLLTSQVLENGVSKPTLADYVSKRHMERVAHGVYLAEDAWPDDLYVLALTNSKIVFSHETALYLHGLMEREPKCISVTVRAGYNATHLRRKGIQVYQVQADVAELGVVEVQTNYGNMVRTYDPERTICDMVRCKATMDVQVFRYAMKEYMEGAHKNTNRLMEYARWFGIESVIRTYTEVML